MSDAPTKYLKCSCAHCGGRIEYPAEAAGESIPCPHCSQITELTVEVPVADDGGSSRSWMLWALMGLLVLGIAGAFAPMLLKKRLQRSRKTSAPSQAAQTPNRTNATPQKPASAFTLVDNFEVSAIGLERPAGSSLLYATGVVHNASAKQRFGVRVEIDAVGTDGATLGPASDYTQTLEPEATWRFKALVIRTNATAVRIRRISEQ